MAVFSEKTLDLWKSQVVGFDLKFVIQILLQVFVFYPRFYSPPLTSVWNVLEYQKFLFQKSQFASDQPVFEHNDNLWKTNKKFKQKTDKDKFV